MEIAVIAHNVRSAYNVRSIFRTADGIGIKKIYLSGYSPCPQESGSILFTPSQRQIAKTALGAEKNIEWEHSEEIGELLKKLHGEGFLIVALEQSPNSISLDEFVPEQKIALILGNEPSGISDEILQLCDSVVEIPMRGKKNSFNVGVAFGIAGYVIYNKMTGK